jgi:hypothetical protein
VTVWIIYFKDTGQGAYVAAPTCAEAKDAFCAAYGDKHPVRARRVKNVDKALFPSTAVLPTGDPRLPRLAALSLKHGGEGR